MYHSFRKITAFTFSMCCFLASAAGCGDKKPETEIKIPEATIKAADKNFEFVLKDEIKNASLSSGLIQIGNDIFRNGGYYTVGQFMEEYGDRYVYAGGRLDLDGVLVGDEDEAAILLPVNIPYNGDRPYYDIYIRYSNLKAEDGEETKVKDAIVYEIGADVFDYDVFDSIWQPGGIKAFPCGAKQSEITACFEKSGLKEADTSKLFYDFTEKKEYDVYTLKDQYAFKDDSAASCMVCGDEKNLYGVCPVYFYRCIYKDQDKVAKSFWIDRLSSEYADTDDWKKYEG